MGFCPKKLKTKEDMVEVRQAIGDILVSFEMGYLNGEHIEAVYDKLEEAATKVDEIIARWLPK